MKIKGKFSKKDAKKEKQKQLAEQMKKIHKQRKMQCECNHRQKNTKTALEDIGDSQLQCSICEAEIWGSNEYISADMFSESFKIVYSNIALVRHEYELDPKFEKSIEAFLATGFKCEEMLRRLEKEKRKKKNKKKGKGNNKKKKKKNKIKRRR